MTAISLARESLSPRHLLEAWAFVILAFFGWRIIDMDPTAVVNALTALVAAIGGVIAAAFAGYNAYLRLRSADKATDSRVDRWIRGDLRRGYVEASDMKHLIRTVVDGKQTWLLSADARAAFAPIASNLRDLSDRKTDIDLADAIMERWDDWLVDAVCKPLGVRNYGCLAIASVVARETDSLMTRLAASPAHPNDSVKPT